MAENARIVIVLTTGEKIRSPEDGETFRRRLAGAPSDDIAFMSVTDTNGLEHWINVHEIAQFHEP
jgi:hypothetical protein